MHELSLATEVLRVCRERMAGATGRLEHVTLAVGELAAVEPDLLRYAWDAATVGTPDEGATLEIEWHAAKQTCESCGPIPDRQPGTWLRLCPHCAGTLFVEGGGELDLLRLSYLPDEAGSTFPA